jgi:eukaryotic-like serine/threonine-protein kinase
MSAWTVPSYAEGWTVPGYAEERLLGEGASGRVVAAVSEMTGQRVAIKYLSPALVRDPSFMWNFRTEAQTLRALDVPQVVKLYDYVEAPGQGAAIVMEMVDGVSLHAMISQQGPTTPESALTVLKGSLLGLAAAHALGIVHRDYKPENVLVDARGDSKLADFGVAIKAGKKALAAGTPLYMAPEQWNGAPNSPATDIYAATAVFFECVTARTPFSGKLGQLRQQHETASVPLERVDPGVQALIVRGMAKNPAERPQSAIAFVAELEAMAAAAYGPEWEERGRSHLAERVAALLPLLLLRGGTPGSSGTSSAVTWLGQPKRKALAIATIAAAAVVAVGAGAFAVTLSSRSHQESLSSASKAAAAVTPAFTAQAAVTPPVTAAHCTTPGTLASPGTFTYKGTLTANAPGKVSYQWVYSSGQPGPVQTATFAAAGHQQVTGQVVHPAKAGTGWAEIKLLSPGSKAATSNKATYRLLCAGSAGGLIPVASVTPATTTLASCTTAPPAITATGSITSKKAEKVTYYWAFSNGTTSAASTLTFTAPGTMAVSPLTITPAGAPASGQAVLVASSPAAATSAPASYTVSCTAQKLSAEAAVSPATKSLVACTTAAPTFTFSGTVNAATAGPVSYYWKLPGGNGPVNTMTFAKPGTLAVTPATYKPASDSASGSGSIVLTSPASAASNAAAFTLTCGAQLTVTSSAPATATVGTAYTGTVTVAGGKGAFTWATVTGLPAGLTAKASSATLTISGTPTTAGTSTVAVSVHDGASPAGTGKTSLTLTVSAKKLVVSTTALAAGKVGTAYSATVAAAGGTGAYKWSATGLPAGLTMSAAGTISGTPTAAATSTVTVTVTDSAAKPQTATASLSLSVAAAPPPTISTTSLPGGTVRVAYSATLAATGGTGTLTWSVSGLPPGLTSAGGTIGGAPTTAGTYSVTVTATAGAAASKTFSVTIAPAVVVPPSSPPPSSPPPSSPPPSSPPPSSPPPSTPVIG